MERSTGWVLARFRRFVRQALPEGTPRSRVAFSADLLATTLESVGRSVAGRRLPRRTVDRWASACAEMVSEAVGFARPLLPRRPRVS